MTDWTEENTNLDWIEKNKDSGAWEFAITSPSIKKEGGNLIVDIWDIGRNDVIDVATVPPPDCSCKCEVVEVVVVRTSIHDIKLDWTDNSNNETGFRVQRKISSRTLEETDWIDYAQTGANVTSFIDYGVVLTAGNVYSYRVYAYNGVGVSDYSNVVQTPSIPDTAHLTITTFAPTVG